MNQHTAQAADLESTLMPDVRVNPRLPVMRVVFEPPSWRAQVHDEEARQALLAEFTLPPGYTVAEIDHDYHGHTIPGLRVTTDTGRTVEVPGRDPQALYNALERTAEEVTA